MQASIIILPTVSLIKDNSSLNATYFNTRNYFCFDLLSISWLMRDNPTWNVSKSCRWVEFTSLWFWWHDFAAEKRLWAIVSNASRSKWLRPACAPFEFVAFELVPFVWPTLCILEFDFDGSARSMLVENRFWQSRHFYTHNDTKLNYTMKMKKINTTSEKKKISTKLTKTPTSWPTNSFLVVTLAIISDTGRPFAFAMR